MRRPGIILPALLAWAALALALPCGAEPDRPHRISAALGDSVQALEDLFERGVFAEADSRGRRLLAETEMRYGPESLEAAAVLDPLARAIVGNDFLSGASEAERMARRALDIRERALGSDHLDVATSLLTLAAVLRALDMRVGEYADELIQRALDIRTRALGPEHPLVASCLVLTASKRVDSGEFDGARRDYELALRIQEDAYGPLHIRLVDAVAALGHLARVTGDDLAARAHFERLLAIRERTAGSDSTLVIDALTELYNLAFSAGDSMELYRLHTRIRETAERCLDPMSPRLAMARGSIPGHDTEKELLLMEGWYREANRRLGPEHITTGLYAGNIGTLYLLSGQGASALTWMERGMHAVRANIPADHPGMGTVHHFLGVASLQAGDGVRARRHLEESLRIRTKAQGSGSREAIDTTHGLARALWLLGDKEGAIQLALEMEETVRSSMRALSNLSERQALRYAATRPNGLGLALRYASESASDSMSFAAWDALVRSRASVLDEMAFRHLGGTDDPELGRLRETLAASRLRAANLMVRGPGFSAPEHYRALLGRAVEEKEAVERALAERSFAFRRGLRSQRLGGVEVRASLLGSGAVVSYCLERLPLVRVSGVPLEPAAITPDSYFALIAPSSGPVQVIRLGDIATIDSLVARWTSMVSAPPVPRGTGDQRVEMLRVGTELRRRVWDPIVPYLHGVSRAFLVPDGSLHLVPFAALPKDSGGYLVESEPTFHYLSAERDLIADSTPASQKSEMLAIGGADFDFLPGHGPDLSFSGAPATAVPYRGPLPECPEFRDMEFEPLPGASREIQEVTLLWNEPAAVRLGREATEARFKSEAPRCGILHVATHGFSLDAGCSDAASDRGIGRLKRIDPAPTDTAVPQGGTLLRSGLALTGANRREEADPDQEDGILTSEEIAALDLSSVRWAVLSACNTGRGEIQAGEGVLGLRRAFQIAGAKTLIMSLWPVDDEGTREWMGSLYRARFERELGTAEAVRAATLETLRARRARGESDHPFYWGAFVAAGDWR